MKKIFIICASVLSVLLLFLGVYNFAFRNASSNPVVDEQKKAESQQATDKLFSDNATDEAISSVTEKPAYAATILDNSHIAYFNERALKRASLGGGGEEVLIKDLPGKIIKAVWAPDRTQVLVLFDMETEQRWQLVNLKDSSVTPLKQGITSPTWSNLSERIYYFYTDPVQNKISLDTAKPDGSAWKQLSFVSLTNAFLSTVPSSTLLSFWNKPSALQETSLYTLPVSGDLPKKIFSGKFGADYLWSPDGSKVLISNTLAKGGTSIRLGTANQNGGEFQTLQAPTFVSKTVWSEDNNTIYYALPLSMPENAVLPDDYYSRPIQTKDSFWKMDVETGKSNRIIEPQEIGNGYDASGLFLSKNEDFLYFTDRTSNQLLRIKLSQ